MKYPFEERLRAAAEVAGITRVAEVTWLDSLGYPVAQAIRPRSRNYVVSQGKGPDQASARISAVMESLEFFLGELVQSEVHSSCAEMAPHLGYQVGALPLVGQLVPDVSIAWTSCRDLLRDTPSLLPFDMVSLDFTRDTRTCFRNTSNGYGAGATHQDALDHALLELIERHCLSQGRRVRLFIDSCVREVVGVPMRAAGELGMKMAIYAYETELPIPVLKVLLHEPSTGIAFCGTAAHPDLFEALKKAAGEAFQSRLTHFSGSRDDLTDEGFERLFAPPNGSTAPSGGITEACCTFTEYAKRHLTSPSDSPVAILCRAGYRSILVKELVHDGIEVPVLVAAVPGLAFTWEHGT